MKLETKHFLLGLLLSFGTKALISGITYEIAACLAVFATTFYLHEKGLENKNIKQIQEELKTKQAELETIKKDIENLKSYTNSMKMNNLRSTGGYPTAQR